MVVFLDTSSLVKLYYEEPGSKAFVQKISEQASELYVFELSKVEFASALWKKVRTKDIDIDTCERILALFDSNHDSYQWIIQDSHVITSAKNLFKKYGLRGLRTLDSLQFAAALKVKTEVEIFVTDDLLLREFFDEEGLNTSF